MDQNQPVSSEPQSGQVASAAVGSKPSRKIFIIAGVIIVAAIALGAAYFVYASPARVWQKFISRPIVPKTVSETYSFSYQDNGKLTQSSANGTFMAALSNVKLLFSGSAYVNYADQAHPEGTMDINYSIGSGNTTLSSVAKLVIKSEDLYINPGNNPLVDSVLTELSPDKKIEWLKINSKDIQDASMASSTSTPSKADYVGQIKKYQDIVDKYTPKLVVQDKYLGREKIRDISALHYSAKLDKAQAKAMAHELIVAIADQISQDGQSKPQDVARFKDQADKIFSSLIDKLVVSNLEVWVGANDYHLRKIKFASNAPSLVSLMSAADNIAPGGTDDNNIDTVLKNLAFDGQINCEEEFYDYGKTQTVNPPADALDVAKKIREQKQEQQKMMQFGADGLND